MNKFQVGITDFKLIWAHAVDVQAEQNQCIISYISIKHFIACAYTGTAVTDALWFNIWKIWTKKKLQLQERKTLVFTNV